jgi:hypothetical protein
MTTKKIIIAIVALGLLFVVGRWLHLQITYAAVEKLTEQYSSELFSVVNTSFADDPLFKAEGVSARIDYFKVFEYSENRAKVFVVISYDEARPKMPVFHDRFGGFRYFTRRNGNWVADSQRPFELVWDAMGSADDETWPPYH